ncbi:MAG: class I fructose-bisphosphate aldolase family protein [Candidatus Methylomirabilia bacterium]
MTGKKSRLSRLIHPTSRKTVLVPLDHGMSEGPIPGVETPCKALRAIIEGGAQGVVIHRGVALCGAEHLEAPLSWLLHLSGSTTLSWNPDHKVLVASVEEALRLGADGVSVHVNLGVFREARMLQDLGKVAARCREWGMPLLAMMYVRWARPQHGSGISPIKHAARVAAELGADLVKVPYPGSPEGLREVIRGCFIPVLIAGGERAQSDRHVLEMVEAAMASGAAGICIGRNIFQHPVPALFLQALSKIIHDGVSADVAIELASESPALAHGRT